MRLKKSYLLSIIITLILLTTLTGCVQYNEDDFIYVNINARALVGVYDTGDMLPEMHVEIRIIKAGAEKISRRVSTQPNGFTDYVSYTAEVYKEQDVQVKGNLLNTLPQELINKNYTIVTFDQIRLTWNEITTFAGPGETYTWNPQLNFLANYEP